MRKGFVWLALILAGCTGGQQANYVAAAEQALTAAEIAATSYIRACGAGVVTVCPDASKVAAIKAADNQAYSAVMAARSVPSDGSALARAQAAIAALLALLVVTH